MNIRSLLITGILATTLCASGGSIGAEKAPQAIFSDAAALMQARKFAEAIPLLEELKASYPTEAVFWNLGISAAEVGDNDKALYAWLAYRNVAPNNWQGRAKLIQTYQTLGKLEARDHERAALVELWKSGADATLSTQSVFCREQFSHEGRKVIALEYFRPTGPTMIVYSFVIVGEAGKPDFKVSLGSYDVTNQIALELGQRPKDKRLFHLDLYRQNLHETYGMYLGQPSYDTIRELVSGVLAGKIKPMSSSSRPTITSQ